VQPSGIPPHQLTLKPSTIAVLICNLAPDDGLTNGTKLIIDRIVSPALLAVRARCPSSGRFTSHLIPRLRFKFNLHRTRTAVVRTQFPLLPAFAITCNRAQCQTLDFVGFDATVPVVSHGSLFVALSRARRAADVALFVGSDRRACDRD
jgi:ATP-dependent DNA helicase PIF1